MCDTSRTQPSQRQWVIYGIDLVFSLVVFYFCREAGGYPKWYWLVTTGVFWTLAGVVTHKLQFEKFRLKRNAVLSLVTINILTYALCVAVWRGAFPDRCGGPLQWEPLLVISALEIIMYFTYNRLVIKKLPFFYEDVIVSEKECEPSLEKGIKVEEDEAVIPSGMLEAYDRIKGMSWQETVAWFRANREDFSGAMLLDSTDTYDVAASECREPLWAVVVPPFNDIRHLNTYFSFVNFKLPAGGAIVIHGETSGTRGERILKENPAGLNRIYQIIDYVWSRVCPKLRLTRGCYMSLTKGRHRNIPRVEILGRLCRAGFTIAGEEMRDGEYMAAAVKTSKPIHDDKPSYGPLIRLRRIGYRGEIIGVFKFRTMFSYSEYLQKYVYERLGLRKGGKIEGDFRVNVWGIILRSIWVDELPMLFNWMAGDLKLVGVRPLSRHYFSLYTPEMQQMHISVKPGLIPPFYYERTAPVTIEDVQASERRYIEAYRKAPLKTDLKYFFVICFNIVFRRRRSH